VTANDARDRRLRLCDPFDKMKLTAPGNRNEAQTALAVAYQDEVVPGSPPPSTLESETWRDGSTRIGIHTSIAGDVVGSLESARKLGCNALQIFSASPRMWPRAGAGIAEADAARFRSRRTELGIGPVVVHANYLINLASVDPLLRAKSIQAFRGEIVRARSLAADFLVVHPGCALGAARMDAIGAVARALVEAFQGADAASEHAPKHGLRVLLENTAGMGSAVGTRFEDLRAILDEAAELPLGVCIDTAHAFAAGYPIHTAAGLAATIAELDRVVGLTRVAVLHVNDSKTAFGSRVDRHAQIGRGQIGLEALRRILTHPLFAAGGSDGLAGRAFILENPIEAPGDDRRLVRTAWKLAGFSAKQAPSAENGFTTFGRSRHEVTAKNKARATLSARAQHKIKREAQIKPARRKPARGAKRAAA
jgi:deoxyribonuclease-4